MNTQEQLQQAIDNLDFKTAKDVLNTCSKGDIPKMRFKISDRYECDIVSFLRMTEKEVAAKEGQGKSFLNFKALLDRVVLKEDANYVVNLWKKPIFGCEVQGQWCPVEDLPFVPTTPQMMGYLGFLEDAQTLLTGPLARRRNVITR